MIRQYLGALLVLAAGIVLAVLIVAAGPEPEQRAAEKTIPVVQTVTAAPRWVQMNVAAYGEVLPKTESSLVAEVSGMVAGVAPAMVAGGFFAKGDTLVEIERVDYEVGVERSRAQLASAESEQDNAEREFQRCKNLSKRQSISQSLLDNARNGLAVARARMREAKANLARAERDLTRTRMTAPYDGRVRSERVDVGQFVNRGESIATLYSIDYAEVRLPVRNVDLAYLPLSLTRPTAGTPLPKVVLKAEFAGAEHTWEADVVRTEGELDPHTRMLNVIAQVPTPYEPAGASPPLTVGLFVEAEIAGVWLENVIVVPRTALQEDDRLFVVAEDGRLSFRDVQVLRIIGETAYLQGDVQSGETICLSALAYAIEGQRVQAVATASS